MNENKKSKIWVYAIILFTSAFVILLLTAYSQIKLNKNLSDYKSQISSQETEKKKVQQNFSSAQEMNSKLNEEIKKLQEENASLKDSLTELDTERVKTEETARNRITAENGLSQAMNAYLSGNIVECAGLLDGIDMTNLEGKLAETFKILSDKVKPEAGKILYDEGYNLYKRGYYSEAIPKLALSFQYAQAESFSDNCLYYLAYSELKTENKSAALESMNKLIVSYPNSSYLKSAQRFVEKYK